MQFDAPSHTTPPTETSPRLDVLGKLLGITGNLVRGWACNPADIEKRIVVELLLDGYPWAIARADSFDPDLRDAGFGDGCHAFAIAVPERLLDATARIEARVANTDMLLDGQIYPTVESTQGSHLSTTSGQCHHTGGLRIHGWAWDRLEPDRHVQVHVYEGERLLLQFAADAHRPDLAQSKIGAGDHGFDHLLPFHLANGEPHELRILDDRSRELAGSPLTVLVSPSGSKTLLADIRKAVHLTEQVRLAPTIDLLERQLESYERLLPRSVGFADYAAWYEVYGPHRLPVPEHTPGGAVAVLVYGSGDWRATINSLARQKDCSWWAWVETSRLHQTHKNQRVRFISKQSWGTWTQDLIPEDVEYVTLIRAGDHLPDVALRLALAHFSDPQIQILYTDCDHDADDGTRTSPWFKPAWDPDLFLSLDYTHHLLIARMALLSDAPPLEDAVDIIYHTVENVSSPSSIAHLPIVLYHRQCQRAGIDQQLERRLFSAVQRHLKRTEPTAKIQPLPGHSGLRRVRRTPPRYPDVSLIIPTRDQLNLLRACVTSILDRTTYTNFELIVIDNQSTNPQTLSYLDTLRRHPQARIISYPHPFNYSAINNMAVRNASGELIGLINNDVEVIAAEWLSEMVGLLLRPGVGAVGAKLLWPNRMLQHAGVILGTGGLASHVFIDVMDGDPGYMGRALVTQRFSAVTAACLLCRKRDYLDVGGLDEKRFPVAFNDVDFCLKLKNRGRAVVWTPFATLFHKESATRGKENTPEKAARAQKEACALRTKWASALLNDDSYSPNLNLDDFPFSALALPPRSIRPRTLSLSDKP